MLDQLQAYIASLHFMLFNADMIYPIVLAITALAVISASKRLRAVLRERRALFTFIATPTAWLLLVPWSALFLAAMDVRHASPFWAIWPLYAVFFGWPILAFILVRWTKGARALTTIYALMNVPGWLLGCFVGAMAISGDWI